MTEIRAWAAMKPGGELQRFTYTSAPVAPEEVLVEVQHCGICHTDLSFIKNEWGNIPFPLVPGHEITGKIVALGEVAAQKGLTLGQAVGVGWFKESCLHCNPCLDGAQHLCTTGKGTIMGSHGGFASHLKVHWLWAVPLPEQLSYTDAGPLLCAGVTVFAPLLEYDLKPTDRVGIFGVGGLGHLAVKFCSAWGADVTAFSQSERKYDDIRKLGADRVVSSRNGPDWRSLQGQFNLILVTVGVALEWDGILSMLAPKGRLHIVGLPSDRIPVSVLSLLLAQSSISVSPGGSRGAMRRMLEFSAHHRIEPDVQHFPMSQINEAIAYVEAGKAHYRVVLDADFSQK
jgi:uncharacterized zinc-type alcohol dehydrogenase-like protein